MGRKTLEEEDGHSFEYMMDSKGILFFECGYNHGMYYNEDGDLYSWGYNSVKIKIKIKNKNKNKNKNQK